MDPTFDPGVNTADSSDTRQFQNQNIYKDLERYPWSQDSTFLAGLASILSSQPTDTDIAQLELLALQVRCFYYNRQNNVSADPTAYEAWRGEQDPLNLSELLPGQHTQSPVAPSNGNLPIISQSETNVTASTGMGEHSDPGTPASTTEEDPQPASFADIVALIQSGQPIPGIRDIPDTVLTGQGSESTQAPRRKPWEQSAE